MASAKETTNHQEIRRWVESRGGRPAQVMGTSGLLRIDFDGKDANLEEIGWDEFFDKFEQSQIKFLYSPEPENRFNKFISR